jgi:hypothetical protein
LSLTARVVKSLAPVTTSRPALHYCTTAPARLCHRCVIPLQSCTDTCKKKKKELRVARVLPHACMHARSRRQRTAARGDRRNSLREPLAACLITFCVDAWLVYGAQVPWRRG